MSAEDNQVLQALCMLIHMKPTRQTNDMSAMGRDGGVPCGAGGLGIRDGEARWHDCVLQASSVSPTSVLC